MKIVFASQHYHDVKGYAIVVYEILSRLVKETDLEVYHYGWRQHKTFRRNKIEGLKGDYVASIGDDSQIGQEKIHKYMTLVRPDILVVYGSNMVMKVISEALPKDNIVCGSKYKVLCYLDQVYKGGNLFGLNVDKFIVFSEQWKMPITTPQIVMTHAPNTFVKPVAPEHCLALRKELEIGDTETVYLSINTNTARKRLDLLLQSFSLHKRAGGEGKLVMITTKEGFYRLDNVMSLEGIKPSDVKVIQGGSLSDETINLFYNMADYGVNSSDGEGWGIMACDMASLGKPQIALDIGAYRTFLNDDTAVLVPPTLRIYRNLADYCGLYNLTTTPELFAEAFDLVKTKSKPIVNITWDTAIEEFKRELSPNPPLISTPSSH
jgi:glycosyltransferase involved in cell wall biosynthesis